MANPVGRPRTSVDNLPDNWRDMLLEIGKDGGSIVEMRAAIGLTQTSWTTLKKDNQDFSDYVDECLLHSQVWWEKQGRKMASGQADGNAPTWIFNMKNRFGWTDKTQSEITGKQEIKVMSVNELTDEQLAAIATASGD